MIVIHLFFVCLCIQQVISCTIKTFSNETIIQVENGSYRQVRSRNGCIESDEKTDTFWYILINDKVPVLRSFAISGLKSLKVLTFKTNEMTSIEANSLMDLPRIESIAIRINELEIIPKGVFKNMPVRDINLNTNRIEYIEKGAFENLANLQEIDLSSNNLTKWKSTWFKNTINLRIINLDDNQIKKLDDYTFADFLMLKNISISHNKLETIKSKAFHGIEGLESIDLSGNFIKNLHDDTFQAFKHLDFLSLNGNYLMFLKDQVLYDLQALSSLHIHDNPWLCGCYDKIIRFANRYRWQININSRHCYNASITTPVCVASVPASRKCVENFDNTAFQNYIENADRRIWYSCPRLMKKVPLYALIPPAVYTPETGSFLAWEYI